MLHESFNFVKQLTYEEKLKKHLIDIKENKIKVYPDKKHIFRAFEMPHNELRLVVFGQDPYPNGEGIGYAFAIKENVKKPKSFLALEKAFNHSLERDLKTFRDNGILLLNVSLTVSPGQPLSYLDKWLNFSRYLAKTISDVRKEKTDFLLLGNIAAQLEPFISKSKVYKDLHPANSKFKGEVTKQIINSKIYNYGKN